MADFTSSKGRCTEFHFVLAIQVLSILVNPILIDIDYLASDLEQLLGTVETGRKWS